MLRRFPETAKRPGERQTDAALPTPGNPVDSPAPLSENQAAMLSRPACLFAPLALVLSVGLLLLAPGPARSQEEAAEVATPTIYKWIDTNGIAHYTTDYGSIPRRLRSSARQLQASSSDDGFDSGDTPARSTGSPAGSRGSTTPRGSEADRWASSDRPRTWEGGTSDGTLWDDGDEVRPEADPREEAVMSRAERDRVRQDIDERISELESDIEADERVLKLYVSSPAPEDPSELAFDSTFREVAQRLPSLLSELRTLEAERAELERP